MILVEKPYKVSKKMKQIQVFFLFYVTQELKNYDLRLEYMQYLLEYLSYYETTDKYWKELL